MLYRSTRGLAEPVPPAAAVRTGLAPDGGLFLPEKIPSLSPADLQRLGGLDYPALAASVIAPYLDDYPAGELRRYTDLAYGSGRFDDPAVTPLVRLDERTFALELWHGPTAAFKDMALQLMPHLLTAAMAADGECFEAVILVATSGDTGKAALEGFRDVPGTRIIVFYPARGVSRTQELQMITQEGANTAVAAVEGNFDDAQTGVKRLFTDPDLRAELQGRGMRFSSANSINWGRLVPQIAYYVSAYVRLAARGDIAWGDPINAAVPTGNFGNILAAWYARAMGVPIARLICASNRNKVLSDFIHTGVYDRRREFHPTVSPSMDILISSNLERLLYLLAGGDAEMVRGWMEGLRQDGFYRVGQEVHRQLKEVFWGGFADEEETRAAVAHAYRDLGYLPDTHTAVGLHVLEEYRHRTGDLTPAVLCSTASPFKFGRAVLGAVAGEAAADEENETVLLQKLSALTGMKIPACLSGLDGRPVLHHRSCTPEGLRDEVREILGLFSLT